MIEKTVEIVKEAGEIIKDGYSRNVEIEFKTDESNLVTEIDKKVEAFLLDYVRKEFPTHSIIAEETGRADKVSDYRWVIDPLDGTTNFAHKLPIFGISVGLQKNDETIMGIIYDVMRGAIYTAEKGSGTFENGNKVNVSTNDKIGRSLLVTGFAYDIKVKNEEAVKIFQNFLTKSRAVRRLGSAAIDFCYVANGIFDGFWEENLGPWDVCAGLLIVEEAGGKISTYENGKVDIFSPSFLATNGVIHNEMVETIQSSKI